MVDPVMADTRDAREESGTPRIGDELAGRYRLEAKLGEGGFGVVFAARDRALDRDVAIKVLDDARSDATTLARFFQEAKAVASLDTEHVVTVHEVALAGRTPYIVMERLRGSDLQELLRERSRLPAAEAIDLVLQATLGVAHAHGRGIVHRDLKPRNLFLAERTDGTRVVKVLDFGIARPAISELTESGAVLGTTRYMAPEQLRSSRGVDVRADIWALGVTLYELTTGASIFDVDNAAELGVKILTDPHVPLRSRVPELPATLAAVVDRCLEKEPAKRFADLADFARALDADPALVARIERALGGGPPTRADALPPRERGRANRWLVVASVLAGAGGIGFGVAMWQRSPAATARTVDAAVGEIAPDAPSVAQLEAPADAIAPAIATDAPVVDAAPPAVHRRRSAKPSPAELAAIENTCVAAKHQVPFFIDRDAQGRVDLSCVVFARIGCAGIVERCKAMAVTLDEKLQCRDFVAMLRETCK